MSQGHAPTKPAIFRGVPNDEVLHNPHMGFQTFQHFNGDPLFEGKTWTEVGPQTPSAEPESLETPNHPYTTVAYCRWYWDTIEPDDGVYRWEIIDSALATAKRRGQTLAIRVMCHDSAADHDVPEWFKKTGARGGTVGVARGKDIRYWVPDYADPLYIKHWSRLTAALAERYDGHPDLETVDLASIGPWGEWSTRPVDPGEAAKGALIECYTDVFEKTPLLSQFDDPWSMRHGVQRGTGWRADCLGDMGGFSPTWSHMRDCYPQGIIKAEADDAWKTAPVAFEVCWVMQHWHEMGWDPDYIFDEAVRWHFSYFNTKSSAVPADHRPAVERVLKRMGYRFVLRKFMCQPVLLRGGMMRFHSWWTNLGCAPIYRRYDLALEFRHGDISAMVKTNADITGWLPGDIVYDDVAPVPYDLPAGEYTVRVAMLDRQTGQPGITLAQDGGEDGWYELCNVEIE